MIWFLCRSLRLNQSINHNRCGGVRHMRQNIYEIWQHLISLRLGQELFYIAKWMLAGLLVTLVKVSVLLSETEHLTLLAAIHVRAICWCVWLPAHIASVQPFYLTGWGRNRFPGLVKWQAITSTKLGQTLVMTVTRTIFNAMKRHCCCQHCFLRERMMRQWEWKRATLYKEDYEDKTALTSLKFEDASTEIWRLSKTRCLSERVAACCFVRRCECDGREKKHWVFTSGLKSWHFTEKHLSTWHSSVPRGTRPLKAEHTAFHPKSD